MKKLWIAYGLWLIGAFGCLGLHRFYLGKVPTGVLWFFTGGLAFAGSLYDLVTLPKQVDRINDTSDDRTEALGDLRSPSLPRETLEQAILRTARSHRGRVTGALVASDSAFTVAAADELLGTLAKQGVCDLRITKAGTTIYHFAEFDPGSDPEFEV